MIEKCTLNTAQDWAKLATVLCRQACNFGFDFCENITEDTEPGFNSDFLQSVVHLNWLMKDGVTWKNVQTVQITRSLDWIKYLKLFIILIIFDCDLFK